MNYFRSHLRVFVIYLIYFISFVVNIVYVFFILFSQYDDNVIYYFQLSQLFHNLYKHVDDSRF